MSSNNRRINLMERFNQVADDNMDIEEQEELEQEDEQEQDDSIIEFISYIINGRKERLDCDEEWSTYASMAI